MNININNSFNNKTIINIDIQPEYKDGFTFELYEWIEMLESNKENNKIVFLYNGESLGFPNENEYKEWLYEYCEASEELIENSYFFDKGYAFFRFCMDEGFDDDSLVYLISYMYENEITDSRDIEDDVWINIYKKYGKENMLGIKEILSDSDSINIPELMGYIKDFDNIVILGGGKFECLREVEIALDALNKKYITFDDFIY